MKTHCGLWITRLLLRLSGDCFGLRDTRAFSQESSVITSTLSRQLEKKESFLALQ